MVTTERSISNSCPIAFWMPKWIRTLFPPQADSFCRKVCWRPRRWSASSCPASSWFFLQKGLQFNFTRKILDGIRLKLILFAERFANGKSYLDPMWYPPQADSFCRKVCWRLNGKRLLIWTASSWFFLQKGLRKSFVLLTISISASSWFFLQKGLPKAFGSQHSYILPPQADSFCRKVCWLTSCGTTSSRGRLKLILFAERFALEL